MDLLNYHESKRAQVHATDVLVVQELEPQARVVDLSESLLKLWQMVREGEVGNPGPKIVDAIWSGSYPGCQHNHVPVFFTDQQVGVNS
jgi:hypothetical protein